MGGWEPQRGSKGAALALTRRRGTGFCVDVRSLPQAPKHAPV